MKQFIGMTLSILLLLCLSSCGATYTSNDLAIYNTEKNNYIKIGMSKNELVDILGTPKVEDEYDCFENIKIKYIDDTVQYIRLSDEVKVYLFLNAYQIGTSINTIQKKHNLIQDKYDKEKYHLFLVKNKDRYIDFSKGRSCDEMMKIIDECFEVDGNDVYHLLLFADSNDNIVSSVTISKFGIGETGSEWGADGYITKYSRILTDNEKNYVTGYEEYSDANIKKKESELKNELDILSDAFDKVVENDMGLDYASKNSQLKAISDLKESKYDELSKVRFESTRRYKILNN